MIKHEMTPLYCFLSIIIPTRTMKCSASVDSASCFDNASQFFGIFFIFLSDSRYSAMMTSSGVVDSGTISAGVGLGMGPNIIVAQNSTGDFETWVVLPVVLMCVEREEEWRETRK